MPRIARADAKYRERQKVRIMSSIEARLPREGLDRAQLRGWLAELGLQYDARELAGYIDELIAAGELVELPDEPPGR